MKEKPDYIGQVISEFDNEDEYCIGILYAQLDELHAIVVTSARSFIQYHNTMRVNTELTDVDQENE